MTPASLKVLQHLVDHPGDDIACSGIECYCGNEQISRSAVDYLIRLCAISASDMMKGEYYEINETGRALLRNPSMSWGIKQVLAYGGVFTIREDKLITIQSRFGSQPARANTNARQGQKACLPCLSSIRARLAGPLA